jgi:hypothetical protein
MNQNKCRLLTFLTFRSSLFLVLVLLTTSCQFLGFGRKSPCDESTLKIGENTYQIKTIKPKSDGSLKIPSNKPDVAYWIEGTNTNYVFGLSPTDNNLTLQSSLHGEETVTVTWENCNSITFKLSAPQMGVPDNLTLLDQSVSGITLFVQPSAASAGFVVKGELSEETIKVFNTPDTSEMQAEISLLGTSSSDDGKNITVEISIMNYGQSPITLSVSDVSLTSGNNASVAPDISEPSLPKEIQPAATETIHFTFPHPSSATATIKIFNAEYELEGY